VIFENASGIEMGPVNPEANFIESGFDSLLLTQVALNLKKEFGLPISFRQLNERYGNLDLLAGFLDEQLPEDKFQEKESAEKTLSVRNDSGSADSTGSSAIDILSRQIESLAKQVEHLQSASRQPSTVNR